MDLFTLSATKGTTHLLDAVRTLMRMQIGGPQLTVLELLPEKFMGLLSLRAGVDSGEVLFYDPQSPDCLPAAHAENSALP